MTEVAARASFDKMSVLQRIHRTWGSLDDFCRDLSDEQMSSGGPDGWTIKDHVAHVAAWQLSLAALLERRDRQAALALKGFSTTDWDGQNEVMLRRHRPLVPSEARALELGSRAMVLKALESLSDDDLGRPYSDFQPQDLRTSFPTSQDCVVHWIVGSIEDHVKEHLVSMRPLV